MKGYFFAAILAALTGCAAVPPAPVFWEKQGITQELRQRDQMGCRQYGMQSAMTKGLAGNMFVESWIQREANNCMQGLGYVASPR